MRYADVHQDKIVFTYEGDLWLASTGGGDARRITSDNGLETWAKFSPDGSKIAFSAQYDGGNDVYVMDTGGGSPTRLTYHPARDRTLGWFPDGKRVLFRSRREYPSRAEMVYAVSTDGGMPVKLPVDRAGLASLSPDGTRIAYNRISREDRTWKRHQGGTAQEIWLGTLGAGDFKKITDWVGSDNFPMWVGNAVYFNSDRAHGTLNLFRHDVATGQVTAMTDYADYDVKYPSAGPGQIVYQYGEQLHLLDLATGETRAVPIRMPSDRVRMRPEFVKVSPRSGSFGLSPSGTRVILEARGEILNLPAEDGEPINLTAAPGSREKNAAWSPDGRWVALISDKTGEEEIYLVDQKGTSPWKQLTKGGLGFRMQPVWSPNSKWLIFSDKFMRLNLTDTTTGETTVIAQGDYDDAWERWGIQDYVWSPDSRWIAYTKMEVSMNDAIFLYSLDSQQTHRLTDEMTQDWSPSFDPEGRYLYFLSNRTFSPIMGAHDQNHIFLEMARPYIVLLSTDEPSPFAPKDSEEAVEEDEDATDKDATDEDDKNDKDDEKEKAEDEEVKTRIDLDGLTRRTLVADGVPAGNYFRLEATGDGFCYLKKDDPEFLKYQAVTDGTGGSLDLYHYDVSEAETTEVLGGIANYHLSADGKKLVYRAGRRYGVADAGKKASVGDGEVKLDDVRVRVDRNLEFLQIFDEAWRLQRDWFYDPGMHGVDWDATRTKYRTLVPDCGNRADLNYLIGEMIGELNIGHTYVYGGDNASGAKRVGTGLLGAEFEVDAGHYRIAQIVPGVSWSPRERSPLDEPGCPIAVGHYLLAIDGAPVTAADNIYAFLQNKRGKVVTLTYNDRPTAEGSKTHRVKTLGSERAIRYRAWVNGNAAKVAEATGGRVGYLHIPDMGAGGLVEFARAFYAQYYKDGLIIDERYNGGGFTGDMIIDRLERKVWAMTQPREGKSLPNPERTYHGHFAVLINEDTGSNGEFFAEAIKRKQLAKVIGMRTWGGSTGMEPHQDMVDGGGVTPPQFGLYGLDGTWPIEGHGVDPDIEVQNMPGDVLSGKDTQLEAGIAYLLERIAAEPTAFPPRPAYPVKKKVR